MKLYRSTLQEEDLVFFYGILYQYEKESSHSGYQYLNVPKDISSKITLIHDRKKHPISLKYNDKENELMFKGTSVSVCILSNLRHAFAHACIERENDYYIINKHLNPKCRICGKVNRELFISLIKEIIRTRK
uniref:Uncharacterized protein n=1 Tax=Prevotella sp. GTC17253 TaxID=3236793 RepID=A0AB33IQQ3_9BACT